jgi:hypothetical protein
MNSENIATMENVEIGGADPGIDKIYRRSAKKIYTNSLTLPMRQGVEYRHSDAKESDVQNW